MDDLGVVDIGMIVAVVDILVVVELEMIGLVVVVVGEDCLREVGLVDEDYLMKVEVVAGGCLMNNPTHFSTYHRLAFEC